MAGKIVIYPQLRDLGLVPLSMLEGTAPKVAASLDGGAWCRSAELELLASFTSPLKADELADPNEGQE
jgi:hypothetical protein